MAYFDKANEFDSKRIQASKHADQILEELNAAANELLNERDLNSDLAGDPDQIRKAYGDLYSSFSAGIKKLQSELIGKRQDLTSAESAWAEKFKKARDARDAVLEKLSEAAVQRHRSSPNRDRTFTAGRADHRDADQADFGVCDLNVCY